MPTPKHVPYPEGWTPLGETAAAVVFDCSPMLALILEAPAGDPVRLRFREFLGALEPIPLPEAGWGFPDFLEACEMLGMSPEDGSERLSISSDEYLALQLGWFHPSLDRLVGIADAFGWPLGALFRNGAELQPATSLARSAAASRKP